MLHATNPQLPRGAIGFALGIAGMLVSLYFSIQFIAGNASGAELIAGIVFCLILDYGKVSLATEALFAMASLRLLSAVCYALIVMCLYALSMLAATFMLTSHNTNALIEQSDNRIATLEQAIAAKQTQLNACNPAYVTRCIKPLNADLNELQAQLSAAQNVDKAVIDAKDRAATWDKLAKALGTSADDLQVKLAFARAVLLEIIAPIFVSLFLSAYRNKLPQTQERMTEERVINEPVETQSIPQQKNAVNSSPVQRINYSGLKW